MSEISKQIIIGIPKGRLLVPTAEFLKSSGFHINFQEKIYSYSSFKKSSEFIFRVVKNCDIPKFVEKNIFNIGFTSLDWISETDSKIKTIKELNQGIVRVVAAIASINNWEKLKKQRIICATEYVNLARKFLGSEKCQFDILQTHGSSEGYIPSNANAIVDIVDKGLCLKNHGLKEVRTLFVSNLNIIANPVFLLKNPQITGLFNT